MRWIAALMAIALLVAACGQAGPSPTAATSTVAVRTPASSAGGSPVPAASLAPVAAATPSAAGGSASIAPLPPPTQARSSPAPQSAAPPSASSTAGTGSTQPTDASGTCAEAFGTGDSKITVKTTRRDRVAYVHVPVNLPASPVPLVFMFHGYGGTAPDAALQSGLSIKGDAEHFVAVYPQGVLNAWNNPGSQNTPADEQDDLDFFTRLLDRMTASGCIDVDRVYLTGHSQGGGISSYFGCRFADRIAAIAIVAGIALVPPCLPPRPLPVLIFHAVTDPVLPYAGGHIADTSDAFPLQLPADEVAADWAQLDGCALKPEQEVLPHQYLRYTWTHCNAPVVFYVVPSGSHDWPGSTFYDDDANLDLNATDVIWDFFAQAHR